MKREELTKLREGQIKLCQSYVDGISIWDSTKKEPRLKNKGGQGNLEYEYVVTYFGISDVANYESLDEAIVDAKKRNSNKDFYINQLKFGGPEPVANLDFSVVIVEK